MNDLDQAAGFNGFFSRIATFCETDSVISEALIQAKKEFFLITGKVKEDEAGFGNRINAFLLWFIFDRRSPDSEESLVYQYKEKLISANQSRELALVNQHLEHVHSIFEYIKTKGGQVILKDIVSKKKYAVPDDNSLLGLLKGSFFETRIFHLNGSYTFANYWIHHPATVKRGILKELKKIKKNKGSIKEFILRLHAYNTKWNKYRSIDIKSICYFDASVPEAK